MLSFARRLEILDTRVEQAVSARDIPFWFYEAWSAMQSKYIDLPFDCRLQIVVGEQSHGCTRLAAERKWVKKARVVRFQKNEYTVICLLD